MNRNTFVAALLLLPMFFQSKTSPGSTVQIWSSGAMHPNEVLGKTGETWYGLFNVKTGFELLPTKITVLDSSTVAGLYQKYVRTDRDTDPVFLIRGLPELWRGPVKTVFFGYFQPRPSNGIALFVSNELMSQYNLYVTGKESTETISDYELILSHQQTKQVLSSRNPTYTEALPTLRWAGDLDGDGKLDILVDMTDHYNASETTLFLSSRAAPNELVKKVASHRKIGC